MAFTIPQLYAIAQPDWDVTRSEAVGQQRPHRGQYDIAMVRAVADAAVCAEYALPLLNSTVYTQLDGLSF